MEENVVKTELVIPGENGEEIVVSDGGMDMTRLDPDKNNPVDDVPEGVTEETVIVAKEFSDVVGTADDLNNIINDIHGLENNIKTSYLDICLKLKEINDRKLYKYSGCKTMNEFCDVEFKWTKMNVSRYLRAAEKPLYLEAGFAPAEICNIKENFTEEQEQFLLDNRKNIKGKDVKALVDYVKNEDSDLDFTKFKDILNSQYGEKKVKAKKDKEDKVEDKKDLTIVDRIENIYAETKAILENVDAQDLINEDNVDDIQVLLKNIMVCMDFMNTKVQAVKNNIDVVEVTESDMEGEG